jgi:hypothetical protein
MSQENLEIVLRYIASLDTLRGRVDDPVGLAALELTEFSSHVTRAMAFEAVGLSEQDAHADS